MLDIGFTELLLVGIVALIVVGPEKLPSTIRLGLRYFRQFKSGFSHIRDEVERELALDEVKEGLQSNKETLRESIGYNELHHSLKELKTETEELKNSKNWYENDHVSDAEIEADLDALVENSGPTLPDANAEAGTGEENDEMLQISVKSKGEAEDARNNQTSV